MVIPEIKVAPLVSHWARFDETPKNSVKFGIIFPVTVVDIEVINAAASNVTKMPVLCKSDIFVSCFIFLYSFPINVLCCFYSFITAFICWEMRI